MTDQELADKVVALGVITKDSFRHDMYSLQSPDGQFVGIRYEAKEIVRDWHVAGAMIEKCIGGTAPRHRIGECFYSPDYGFRFSLYGELLTDSESLPRAINEACCEALS